VAHILPKLPIIIVTFDLVLGVIYGTFHYEKHIGKYSKTKTFKGCVILMLCDPNDLFAEKKHFLL